MVKHGLGPGRQKGACTEQEGCDNQLPRNVVAHGCDLWKSCSVHRKSPLCRVVEGCHCRATRRKLEVV
jgi:hypothetical protein